MPSTATWMDLEIITLSKPDKDKYHMILLICVIFLKNDTNEFIYKTETDSQAQKTNLWLPKGDGINQGFRSQHTHITIYQIDNQVSTAQHSELYSIFCNNPQEKICTHTYTYTWHR